MLLLAKGHYQATLGLGYGTFVEVVAMVYRSHLKASNALKPN